MTTQEDDTKQRTTESSPNRRTSAFFTKSICEKGPTGTTLKTSLVWIPSRWRATLTFSKHRSTKNCTIIRISPRMRERVPSESFCFRRTIRLQVGGRSKSSSSTWDRSVRFSSIWTLNRA